MVIRAGDLFLLGGFLRGLYHLLRSVLREGFAEGVLFKALSFGGGSCG